MLLCYCHSISGFNVLLLCYHSNQSRPNIMSHNVTALPLGPKSLQHYIVTLHFGSSRDVICVTCVNGKRRRGVTYCSRVNLFQRDPDARSNIMQPCYLIWPISRWLCGTSTYVPKTAVLVLLQ